MVNFFFVNFINNKNSELSQLAFIEDNIFYEIKKRKLPLGENLDVIPDFGNLELNKLTKRTHPSYHGWVF